MILLITLVINFAFWGVMSAISESDEERTTRSLAALDRRWGKVFNGKEGE